MRSALSAVLIAALLSTTLAGCQTGSMGTKEGVGTVGGAVAGGLIGSRFGGGSGKLVAVGIGTLLGAFAGRELGSSLDRADQTYADQAATRAYAAPIGQQIRWNNPQSGNQGTIVPIRDGYAEGGAYCREFQQTIVVGGRTEQAHGTACRQPDGSWKIAS
ncbi:RT0821/Lpp0805 family surface protein [Azospirillum doebereinerae]